MAAQISNWLQRPIGHFFRHEQPVDNAYRRTSRSSRGSGRTTRSSRFEGMEPQIIAGSWVNERKLKQLLSLKFGREYRLHVGAFVTMSRKAEIAPYCSLWPFPDEIQYIQDICGSEVD